MPESGVTIHFIVNPKAGSGNASAAVDLLSAVCIRSGLKALIHPTGYPGHATELARSLSEHLDPVFAVGGDGTVREVAVGLTGGNAPLGIIPCGSGNGLARHLRIPMDPVDAFHSLESGRVIKADALTAGGKLFFNIAGLGFDGLVAHAFNTQAKRGLINYIKLIIRWYFKSSEFEYELRSEGFNRSGKAFIIAFANGSQYGNNARIAQGASVDDGKIDVVIVRKPSLLQAPLFTWRVMIGTISSSSLVKIVQLNHANVVTSKPVPMHLDGEAAGHTAELLIDLMAGQLNLLSPA